MLHLHTMKEIKQVVTDIHITKQYVTMSDPISYMPWLVKKDEPWASTNTGFYKCEICGNDITKEDYEFCDICPDCLDEEI